MSLIEVAILALQGVTLSGLTALLVRAWSRQLRRPGRRRVPAHVDHDLLHGAEVDLGSWGRVRVDGWDGSLGPDGLRLIEGLDGLHVYDLWALSRVGWVQLVPDGGRWTSPLLEGEPVTRLRLWVDPSADLPDTRPARQAAPMLLQATLALGRRLPASPEVLRLPVSRGEPGAWAEEQAGDVLVAGLLDEWTEACLAASRIGWVLSIPTGEGLLPAWARSVSSAGGEPQVAFARWLVGLLGKAARSEPMDRATVARRDPVARKLFTAAGRLLRALDESLVLDASPPAAVGPRHRERWLVDPDVATLLNNAPVNGLVQPVVVLRPALLRGSVVLLEGEVA